MGMESRPWYKSVETGEAAANVEGKGLFESERIDIDSNGC